VLVFEGPDGAGKTTLIKAFQEAFDIPVASRVVSKETTALVNLRIWVDANLDAGFQNTIFDRHRLISETIYGPILRSEPQPGFGEIAWLAPRMKRFYEIEPIIIYCLPSLDQIKANLFGDNDNAAVFAHIEQIYSAYVARASLDYTHARTTVHVWDYQNSIQIDGLPIWFNDVHREMKEKLAS
jgi:hypothetical protein